MRDAITPPDLHRPPGRQDPRPSIPRRYYPEVPASPGERRGAIPDTAADHRSTSICSDRSLLEELLRRLHFTVENLASGSHGQLVHQPDMARVLVCRHPLSGERAQLRRRGGRTRLGRHGSADSLAKIGMRDSNHGPLSAAMMLVEDLLNLARVHVVPAADDQVLLAADNEEIAVVVQIGRAHV